MKTLPLVGVLIVTSTAAVIGFGLLPASTAAGAIASRCGRDAGSGASACASRISKCDLDYGSDMPACARAHPVGAAQRDPRFAASSGTAGGAAGGAGGGSGGSEERRGGKECRSRG